MSVAITDDHTIIFIDKKREGSGNRIDAATHLLRCDWFCLEGDGGRRNVFIVNGSDALGIVQSHWPDETVHLQAFDPLVNGLLASAVQEFSGLEIDFRILLSKHFEGVLDSTATGCHEKDDCLAF